MHITKSKIQYTVAVILLIIIAVAIQSFIYQSWWLDDVSIWIFDVGQGDSILIDSKIDVLVDGGPSSSVIEKLTLVYPFWDRTLDYIVNTHPHADHLTGLVEVLNRYQVDEVWTSGQDYSTSVFDLFNDITAQINNVVWLGKELKLQDNVELSIVWPITSLENKTLDGPNDGSIAVLVDCFGTKILLTGDIGVGQEHMIMSAVGDIDILKVAHQGSKTSSSQEFLQYVDPEVAIISVGENDYGHPHAEVLGRLDQLGAQVYRTDIDGDIRIICSPDGYEIKTY